MYKLLLILKYLRRKLAPLFASASVGFCTFMVIVVISVMGGFLAQFKESAQKLTGDIVIGSPYLNGFEDYDELSARLTALPEVAKATPIIDAVGLLDLGQATQLVVVQGVHMEELADVVPVTDALLWDAESAKESAWRTGGADLLEAGRTLTTPQEWTRSPLDFDGEAESETPAIVIGAEVYPWPTRGEDGAYSLEAGLVGGVVKLTVAAVGNSDEAGAYRPTRQSFAVVNEFKIGLYEFDKQTVFVPFEWLQQALEMHRREVYPEGSFDELTGRPTGDPVVLEARASRLVVDAVEGADLDVVAAKVKSEVEAWSREQGLARPLSVQTWEQVHGQLIGAVQNEKFLVTVLFSVISMVAVVMVALTFYMIVLEKTRDIGVLRAIGASRGGIMGMFVGYGLVIGVVGAVVGAIAAVALVTNLNEIQDAIANLTGWRMWNPQTYFFDRIPDQVDPFEAGCIMAGAILSSVIGSLVPAWLASRMDPVEALRYE